MRRNKARKEPNFEGVIQNKSCTFPSKFRAYQLNLLKMENIEPGLKINQG